MFHGWKQGIVARQKETRQTAFNVTEINEKYSSYLINLPINLKAAEVKFSRRQAKQL